MKNMLTGDRQVKVDQIDKRSLYYLFHIQMAIEW